MKNQLSKLLILAIALSPLPSQAVDGDTAARVANQVANAAGDTIDKVQSQRDAQLARLLAEYSATSLVILDMKAVGAYNQQLSQIDDPTFRMAANAGTYAVVLSATAWGAWRTLQKIAAVPRLIKATPGVFPRFRAVGAAAFRTAVMAGVVYTVWQTNAVLLLDKQDFNEILMKLEARAALLEKQLGMTAKQKFNPDSQVPAANASAPAQNNQKLFKLD